MAALLALGLPGAVSGSSDSCTQTLSNAGTSTGGSSRDVICGTNGNDRLEGRGGNDELRGFGGNDNLIGGIGGDELFGAGGNDSLFGESGNDRLNGGPGGDEPLDGGSGNDVIVGGTGEDLLTGGTGDDTLLARDGDFDSSFCGDGTDSVDLDLLDGAFLQGPILGLRALRLLLECEDITIGAVNEGPNVVISRRARRVSQSGRTTVRLRCPRSLPSRCRGRLKLQLATRRSLRRRAPRTRYSIRPGTSRRVRVRLSRRDRRSLRRRRRAQGVVTSVERGQHGRKTTVETARLSARR